MVVHGFRNGGDRELRYLNFHAPGQGFADYMRAMRDGRTLVYDQEPPPAEGIRSPDDAVLGGAERVGGGALLHAEIEAIAVAELELGPGDPPVPDVDLLYVLSGDAAGAWAVAPGDVTLAAPARVLAVQAPARGLGAALRAR
jgi:hypothetical protein